MGNEGVFSQPMLKLAVPILVLVLLSSCGRTVSNAPIAQEQGVPGTEKSVASQTVVPRGFSENLSIDPRHASLLLSSSFSVADAGIRAMLVRSDELFTVTFSDGAHRFSARAVSMGLSTVTLRRDLVAIASSGNGEILAVVEYEGRDGLLASEVVIFSIVGDDLEHMGSYIAGSTRVDRIVIDGRTVRLRVDDGSRKKEKTFVIDPA